MTELDLIGRNVKESFNSEFNKWYVNWGKWRFGNDFDVVIYCKVIIIKWYDYNKNSRENADLILISSTGRLYYLYPNSVVFKTKNYEVYCIEHNIPYEIIDKTK